MEGVVAQKVRAYIQIINVRVAHIIKHGQTLGMFGDGVPEDILLHQRDAIRIQWHQFHQVGSVPEGSTVEGLAHQVSSSTFICLGDFHMDCFDKLHLGWGRGLAELAIELGGEARDLMFLVPSQIFVHLNPRAMVGSLGCRQHWSPSRSSVRLARLVCL